MFSGLTDWLWAFWLIVAMVFFLAEVFTAGFVLAAFGVGAVAAAIAAFLGFGLPWQLAIFIVVSTIAVLFSRRFADRISGPEPQRVGVNRVLGKQAVVVRAIEPPQGVGIVRVEREEWRAQAEADQTIPVDAMVEVIGVEGTRLLVRPVDQR